MSELGLAMIGTAAMQSGEDELNHLRYVTRHAYYHCHSCGTITTLNNLTVPEGSPVLDTFPPHYVWRCVDQLKCRVRREKGKK